MDYSFLLHSFFSNQAQRNPKRVAVYEYDSGVYYTYSDLQRRARQVACFLTEIGVCKGERIALCSTNAQWCIDLFYAMPLIGGILTTYNCRLRIEELERMLQNEAPSVLLYENVYSEKAAWLKKKFPNIFFITLGEKDHFADAAYADILTREPSMLPPPPISEEDILMLCHTGGTTGTPKAAMLSYRAILYSVFNQIVTFNLTQQDRLYIAFPLFHMAGWIMLLAVLQCGGYAILKRQFDVESTLRMTEEEQLSFLTGSPSVLRRLLKSPSFNLTDFSSVRAVRCGAAPADLDIVRKFQEIGIPFLNGYGLTEAGPGVIGTTQEELSNQEVSSIGKPTLFVEAKIIDENGNPCPDGQHGEILIRSAQLFSGYWNDPSATQQALKDGWLYTGDIAWKDNYGRYHICGRKKHMFISNGENIYPLEIETLLLTWPEIKDAYVFGVPDNICGEVGKALVVLQEGTTIDETSIRERLMQQLSTIKIPKYIQIVGNIPRNEVGKVLTSRIAEVYSV